MEETIFNKIKRASKSHGSFALWSEGNLNDTSIIQKNINMLHGRVIFVGGNPSGKIPGVLRNFHKIHRNGRDGWLAETLGKHPYLKGSYMTDLFKNDLSPTENKVKNDKDILKKNLKILNKEISILSVEYNPKVIAIGKKTFKFLKDADMNPEFLPHYSSRSRIRKVEFKRKVTALGNKLQKSEKGLL